MVARREQAGQSEQVDGERGWWVFGRCQPSVALKRGRKRLR